MESKGDTTKALIIRESATLFLEKGYSATSLSEILIKTSQTKGSFYFHFLSKKDLGEAVAKYYGKLKINELRKLSVGQTWHSFIDHLLANELLQVSNGQHFGCPNGFLGAEMTSIEPTITSIYAQNILSQIALFQEVLERELIKNAEAKIIAKRAFSLYEGRLLLFRITGDKAELIELAEDLKELVK